MINRRELLVYAAAWAVAARASAAHAAAAGGYSKARYDRAIVIDALGGMGDFDPKHPDDNSREDVVALEPSEEVVIYRNFRTFTGHYVAHCHNLAHEDHNMMFGFEVVP